MTSLHLRDVRRESVERLRTASETPALDVDLLLCAALGVERAFLLAHLDDVLPNETAERFAGWLDRGASGEPIAYILGVRGFYDREFFVTPDVLIPRPETELLLEQALAWAGTHPVSLAADIGTGSGALAVTFAAHFPAAQVVAVDISPAALAVARLNAERQGMADRLTFLQGDLLGPLIERGRPVDLVMANLPYIPTGDLPELEVTKHEPLLALDGGPDGLDLVRVLLAQAAELVRPGALLLLEIGAGQGEAALAAVHLVFPAASATILPDYAGHDRIVRVEL